MLLSLSLGSLSGTSRSLLGACHVENPVGVTLAAAEASATLSIDAAALALGGLSGTGRSLLGACTADRPVGCEANRRGCVGYALDRSCSGSLSEA